MRRPESFLFWEITTHNANWNAKQSAHTQEYEKKQKPFFLDFTMPNQNNWSVGIILLGLILLFLLNAIKPEIQFFFCITLFSLIDELFNQTNLKHKVIDSTFKFIFSYTLRVIFKLYLFYFYIWNQMIKILTNNYESKSTPENKK